MMLQLNDCWACTSWAIVDFFRRPKLAYYALKRVSAYDAKASIMFVTMGKTLTHFFIALTTFRRGEMS